MTRLRQFGFSPGGDDTSGIARIVSAHGDYYHLVCDEAAGEVLARKKKSAFLRPGAVKPMTGDFVRFTYNRQGESMITEVLPRFSKFERKDPAARRQAQTLAVNFDVLLIMMAVNEDFRSPGSSGTSRSPRRWAGRKWRWCSPSAIWASARSMRPSR